MPGIFISHSSKDKVLAHSLADRLRARSYANIFLDFKSIPGGTEWEKEIYAALHKSTVVLLCATPKAMESKWVFAEIVLARALGKTFIPLIMETCELPGNVAATTQYIDLTNDPEGGYAKLWDALTRAEIHQTAEWPPDKSPFPGLVAFTDEYAPVFFGRDRELEESFSCLRPGAQQKRFLSIIGPSGSGKSSFARAGILPLLKRGVIPGAEKWAYVQPFMPGETPFRNLAEKIRVADKSLGLVADIEKHLRSDGLLETLLNLRQDDGQQIVLLVDQLEEIERRTPRETAAEFLAGLRAGLDAIDTPLIVLATLRADFVKDCLQFPDLAALLQRGTQMLGVMDHAALRQVLLSPAETAGLDFEKGLVEEILDEIKGGDALPLLAHTLQGLWLAAKKRGETCLTRADYRASGGVTGALAARAQAVYEETPEPQRAVLLQALTELADVNERGDFTRRRRQWKNLPVEARPALERFVKERLLVASGNENEKQIEVAHEALLRNLALLRDRLEVETERLRLRHDLELDAQDWENHGFSPAYLWTAERAETNLEMLENEPWLPDDVRRAFLDASRKQGEELEQRVLERTAQLEAANKELESFSYSVSHDFRAPLRAIDGFSRILQEDFGEHLPKEAQSILGRILAASHQMGQLIDDLLSLSRITRVGLHENSVNLSMLVHSVLNDLQLREPERDVIFKIDENLTAFGDERLLRTALENLLNNAWKFTSKMTQAQIWVGQQIQYGETIFYIKDNGAGFDMGYSDKLFGPFQRLHRSEEFPGTGIGLAIVQRIIMRHGGRIWAEGKVDRGATFYFTLKTAESGSVKE